MIPGEIDFPTNALLDLCIAEVLSNQWWGCYQNPKKNKKIWISDLTIKLLKELLATWNIYDLSSGQQILISSSLSPLVCYLQETLLAENIGQHYEELGTTTAPIVLIPMSYHTSTVITMMSDVAISIITCLNYLYTVYTSNSKKACKNSAQPLLTITARITTANMSYHTTDWESNRPQLLAGWWYRTWIGGRCNLQPWKPGGNASQRFWKAN